MLAVSFDSFPYRLMTFAHIVSAVAAFGPVFVYPALRRSGAHRELATLHMRLTFPALVVLWVLGMGLAGMSENVYELKQLWLALSVATWAALMVVSWVLIRPAITDESETATARLSAGVGMMHLGLVIGLVLMIWKPGF